MIVYWPARHGPSFGDDFMWIFPGWPVDPVYFFTHLGYDPHSYRPLQSFMLALIQRHFGWEAWPIHLLAFVLHACLCGLIFIAARRLRFSLMHAGIATAFAMLWQFASSAVVRYDSFSQLGVALFGASSVFVLWSAHLSASRGRRMAFMAGSLLFSAIAMLFKETGAAFLVVNILCMIFWNGNSKRVRLVALVAAYIVMIAAYFALRSQVHALRPADVYYFGRNITQNIGVLVVSAVATVSSVTTATAVHNRDVPVLLIIILLSALSVVLTVAGIRKSGRGSLAGCLLVLAFVALVPVMPLPHVSELYLYNAMPFLALTFGLAMGTLIDQRCWRTPAAGFVMLWLALNAQAVHSNAEMVADNGRRAMKVMDVIQHVLPTVPHNGRILLVHSPARLDYSIFLADGFGVMDVGAFRVGELLGRPDVEVQLVRPAQAQLLAQDSRNLIFTFQKGEMRGPYDTPVTISAHE
jgi:hypothetical protein